MCVHYQNVFADICPDVPQHATRFLYLARLLFHLLGFLFHSYTQHIHQQQMSRHNATQRHVSASAGKKNIFFFFLNPDFLMNNLITQLSEVGSAVPRASSPKNVPRFGFPKATKKFKSTMGTVAPARGLSVTDVRQFLLE